MATIKYEVITSQKRKDGTWNVKIRITHQNKVRRVSTPFYVTQEQLTKGGRIKDNKILAVLDDTVRIYRERINEIGIAINGMDIDIVIPLITDERKVEGIRFKQWASEFVEKKSTPGVYRSALNSFVKYVGLPNICFHDITSNTLQGWVDSLKPTTARNLAPRLRHIFEAGRNALNDEDAGRIVIPNNPFSKLVLPKAAGTRKRAVSAEVIRLIAMVPDDHKKKSLQNLARDMFLLSFCTIGMNAADIYTCTCKPRKSLDYERMKTREHRADNAFISVDINRWARPIIDEYADSTGERTFNLHRRYSNHLVFDNALSHGMRQLESAVLKVYKTLNRKDRRTGKDICADLNIYNMNYYAARHSWATIARNDCRIDKWTVHEALNHVDSDTRIDDTYIKRDFKAINDANEDVMQYVWGFFDKIADDIIAELEIVAYICTTIFSY